MSRQQGAAHHEAIKAPQSILSTVLVGHAHKAVAPMLPSGSVEDEGAFGHLAAGLEQGTQAPLVHALRDVPHIQVAAVAPALQGLGSPSLSLLLLPAMQSKIVERAKCAAWK